MAEDELLPLDRRLDEVARRLGPRKVERVAVVVVASDQALRPVEPVEDLAQRPRLQPHGEVANVPDVVRRPDPGVPGRDHGLVHGRGVAVVEGAAAHSGDLGMPEVLVGGQENGHGEDP